MLTQKQKVISIPTLKTKLLSIHKLKPSKFRPAHKTEVVFDPRTKKLVKFGPDANTESNSIPQSQTNVISLEVLGTIFLRT